MRGGTPQAGRHAAAQLQVSSSCRRYPTLLERQVVDRRQLTGKMKSTALEKNTTGSASPRRTIVLSLAKANSVILGVSSVRRQRSSLRSGLFCAAEASSQCSSPHTCRSPPSSRNASASSTRSFKVACTMWATRPSRPPCLMRRHRCHYGVDAAECRGVEERDS